MLSMYVNFSPFIVRFFLGYTIKLFGFKCHAILRDIRMKTRAKFKTKVTIIRTIVRKILRPLFE